MNLLNSECEWDLIKDLGTGGFGVVRLWRHKQTNEHLAVKQCSSHPNHTNAQLSVRWSKEVEFMTNIENDNIVKAYPVIQYEFFNRLAMSPKNPSRLPILIMEYCDGGDLRNFINKIENINGLPESEVRAVLYCLRNAIRFLHDRGITHRDIKPENIVMKKGPNGQNVYKLTDLGLAKNIDHTSKNSLVGTLEYVAPEFFEGDHYSKTVDYWSMGIIAFEVICGYRPFLPFIFDNNRLFVIKNKDHNYISITPNKDGTYEYHSRVPAENMLSLTFSESMNKWLKIALEYDFHRRGAPDEGDNIMFEKLENILTRKILTIFSLATYEYLCFPIEESTTMTDFYNMLETKLRVDQSEIYIVLPSHHLLEDVKNDTKPIDLFISDSHNEPMIYVTVRESVINAEKIQPNVPMTIRCIFDCNASEACVPYLLRFAHDIVFMISYETQLYRQMLKGLGEHAMFLEQLITNFDKDSDQLNRIFFQTLGAYEIFLQCIITYENELKNLGLARAHNATLDKWTQRCSELKNYIIKEKNNILQYTTFRHRVAEKLKIVIENNKLLLEQTQKDLFYLDEARAAYKQIYDKRSSLDVSNDFRAIYLIAVDSLKRRDSLLMSKDFEEVQDNINAVRSEYQKVKAGSDLALRNFAYYGTEIKRYTDEFLREAIRNQIPHQTGYFHVENNASAAMQCSQTQNLVDCVKYLSLSDPSDDAQVVLMENKSLIDEAKQLIFGEQDISMSSGDYTM